MHFLATTAIERFWDKKEKILFLTEGCCRFSRRKILDEIDYKVMPGIWEDESKIEQILPQLKTIYEKVLRALTISLNELHHKAYSERYWRIVVGRWAYQYVLVMYERYYSIMQALEVDKDFQSISLDESCFIIPKDLRDFCKINGEDFYNLQIYTQIFSFFGKKFPTKKLVYEQPGDIAGTNVIDTNSNEQQPRIRTDHMVMNHHSFSQLGILVLLNKCNFPIDAMWSSECVLPPYQICYKTRKKLKLVMQEETDFERFICQYIFYHIPISYIEGYQYIEQQSYNQYPAYKTIPHSIFTTTSFDTDEAFKQWAAACSEEGTKLIGAAHSVSPVFWTVFDDHMETICDCFYAPGLILGQGRAGKILSSPKFCDRIESVKLDNREGILFTTTNTIRFFEGCGFGFRISFNMEEYFQRQKKFFELLSDPLKKLFKVRMYQNDYGQDVKERWQSYAQNIVVEGWDVPYTVSIQQSRLIISDNFQTTLWEAMLDNRPVVIFWNYTKHTQYILDPEVRDYLDDLNRVGILHDSPESAAKMVNRIYMNIESWWKEPVLQEVRIKGCKLIMGCSEYSVDEWVKELNKLYSNDIKQKGISSLNDYLSELKGDRIALFGVTDVSQELIQRISKIDNKEIVSIIDTEEDRIGKFFAGIEIVSVTRIMESKPEIIIISNVDQAKEIEHYLNHYVARIINIINPARDFTGPIFQELLIGAASQLRNN